MFDQFIKYEALLYIKLSTRLYKVVQIRGHFDQLLHKNTALLLMHQ